MAKIIYSKPKNWTIAAMAKLFLIIGMHVILVGAAIPREKETTMGQIEPGRRVQMSLNMKMNSMTLCRPPLRQKME